LQLLRPLPELITVSVRQFLQLVYLLLHGNCCRLHVHHNTQHFSQRRNAAAAVTFKWSTTAAGLEGFESWSDAKMDFVMPKGTAWA
jgi:hypothetical protein